jgi:hypothetical protein
VLVVACALVCALPVIGGLLAGSIVDQVLDSPLWLAGLAALAVAIVTLLALRRARERSDGC